MTSECSRAVAISQENVGSVWARERDRFPENTENTGHSTPPAARALLSPRPRQRQANVRFLGAGYVLTTPCDRLRVGSDRVEPVPADDPIAAANVDDLVVAASGPDQVVTVAAVDVVVTVAAVDPVVASVAPERVLSAPAPVMSSPCFL